MAKVRLAGLLDPRRPYYLATVAGISFLFVAGWATLVVLGDTWWQLLNAVFLAFVFTHSGFLVHDSGHRQAFRSRRANRMIGLIYGNLAVGLSYGWWVDKHHRHHIYPNHEDRDPDISTRVLVLTADQARRPTAVQRTIARFQSYLFFPLLTGQTAAMYVKGIQALWARRDAGWRTEVLLLLAHGVLYYGTICTVLSPGRAVAFIAVQQGLTGVYLGCVFAPNHKGMPLLDSGRKTDFLTRQVVTSRNVSGGRLVAYLFGGLNYQIEHHLFPSMPRPSLRRARAIVRSFCHEEGLPYVEVGPLESYREVLRHLRETGRHVPGWSATRKAPVRPG